MDNFSNKIKQIRKSAKFVCKHIRELEKWVLGLETWQLFSSELNEWYTKKVKISRVLWSFIVLGKNKIKVNFLFHKVAQILWSWCWYTLDLAVPGSIPTIAIYFCVSCRNGENDNFKKSKVQSSSPNNDNATSSWLSTTENAEK